MSILIKNVLFNDKTIDIYIEGKEIKQIERGCPFLPIRYWMVAVKPSFPVS